jgi:hypothetical protein
MKSPKNRAGIDSDDTVIICPQWIVAYFCLVVLTRPAFAQSDEEADFFEKNPAALCRAMLLMLGAVHCRPKNGTEVNVRYR